MAGKLNQKKCVSRETFLRKTTIFAVIASLCLTMASCSGVPYTDEEVLDEVLKFVPENLGAAQLTEASIVEYHGSGVYEIEVNYEQKSWTNPVKRSNRRARDEKWFLAAYPDIDDFTPQQYLEEIRAADNDDDFEVVEEAIA